MEWNNLKAPTWDLTEMEETSLNNIETMDGGSSRFGDYRTKGEFCVDLKLGQVGNSSKSKDVSKMTCSTGSSKRARAINNGTQIVSCLVDGCQADLSNCRDYHRRHKVCELHSKTAQVTIAGHKQRFCQQCSRFHSLEEFDEGKRSCRKRLDGHNKRRRKPQAEAISRSGSFLSNYQGTQLLPFSTTSHLYPSTTMMNPTWAGGDSIRFHNNHNQQMHHHVVEKQDLFLGTSSSSPTNNTLQNNQHHLLASGGSINQTFHRTNNNNNPFSERCKMFCDNNSNNTSCALSLLSSAPPTQTHDGLNHMVNTHHHHHNSSFMQPLGLNLQDHVLDSNEQSSAHCSSIYNMASSNQSHSHEENNNNQASPLFPFQWD